MGERKGTNKYYPPDFDPQKHKSLAGYTGQHPLRERAKKIKQGILVIRFEMPYNIWCEGCNKPIGMGVRYNAEKSKIGNYYTTPIYKFRMKCHLCKNYFEIKTDPANHDYVIITGARRKEQRWDPKENEQIVPEDRDSRKKLALDAMYQLEHGANDKKKMKTAMPALALIEEKQSVNKDDYLLNKLARNMFRSEKKALASTVASDKSLLEKSSLDIQLVPEDADDVRIAGLLKFNSFKSFDERQAEKKDEIKNTSIFQSASTSSTSPTSSSRERLAKRARYDKLVKAGGFGRMGETSNADSLSKLKMSIKRTSNQDNSSKDDASTCSTSSSEKDSSENETKGPYKETDEGQLLNESALGSLVSYYDSSDSADSSESQDTHKHKLI